MPSSMDIVDRSYLLGEKLGEGGMGAVYRATQLVNRQQIALKVVSEHALHVPENTQGIDVYARLALAREFQTLASLHHPNVIRVLNYGFDEQLGPYFIMDVLNGAQTLLEAAASESLEGKVRLIAQLLRALAYIHQRGVIHRDLKPGNVLVVGDELKLLDFGIAQAKSETADMAGSLEYMAPELMHGQSASVASDLYAVGVLFHQMLSGNLPKVMSSSSNLLDQLLSDDFDSGADAGEKAESTWEGPALNLDAFDAEPLPQELSELIPPEFHGLLRRLLAPRPEQRYTDALAVLRELATTVSFELPVETAATRESFLRATVFIGREAELNTLVGALQQAKTGAGGAYLIGGESGIGKSRLISELRTLGLVYGFWFAEGQSASEGGYYYQEWLPLLRALCFRADMSDAEAAILKGLLPDIGQLLDRPIPDPPTIKPAEVAARIASTVVSLLQRLSKPLLLILEDLHWARSESLALLIQITQQCAQLPILIIGTFRSDEVPQLAQNLPAMQFLQLRKLENADIARLSESILGAVGQRPKLVDYLARQTEGNVFFLVEIIRTLAENAGELTRIGQGELPESVLTSGIEKLVERRIDHLPATFQPWLAFAAVLGRTLDLAVMELAFPGMPLRAFLIECANAAVLESQGSSWLFAHNKLREAILHRIDPQRRKSLHRDVAEAIESVHTGEGRHAMSATLAYHYEEAGLFMRALQYYLQAGDSATKLCLYEDARAHYAAATAILKQLPDSGELRRLHVDILLKQVHAGLINDAAIAQLRRLEEARTLLESLSSGDATSPADRLRMARVDYYTGRAYYYAGQPKEALHYYQRALPIGKEFGDQELMVLPSYVIGMTLYAQGQFGKSLSLLGQTLEPIVQHFGVSLDAIRCVMFHCCALAATGHCQEALAGMERPHRWARELEQPVYLGMWTAIKCIAVLTMADWPTAVQVATQLLALSKRSSEVMFQYMAMDTLGWANSYLGNHAEAAEYRAKAVEIRRPVGGNLSGDFFDAAEGGLLLNAGRPDAALQHAKKVAASSQLGGLLFSQAIAERVWGCALARLGGDWAEVESHFVTSIEICRSGDQAMNEAQTELWWGRMCKERGDKAAAKQHFERAIRQIEAGGYQYALQEARRLAQET